MSPEAIQIIVDSYVKRAQSIMKDAETGASVSTVDIKFAQLAKVLKSERIPELKVKVWAEISEHIIKPNDFRNGAVTRGIRLMKTHFQPVILEVFGVPNY